MAKYTYCDIQALSAQFDEPEEGRKPAVKVKVKVTACASDPSRVGQEFSEYLSLSGGAVEFTMKSLRGLGWSCNDITELTGVGTLTAVGGIHDDTYNGKTRERINIWPKDAPKAKVSGAAKKTFAAQFKAAAASLSAIEVGDHNKALERNELPDTVFAPPPAESTDEDPFAEF
jgi:hypothetical protein